MTSDVAHDVRIINATADDDWLLLQPVWDVVLAHRDYTSSPLFLVFVANGFFFVCMIPYIILDFYGLDHWDWVKRYGLRLRLHRHRLESTSPSPGFV